MGPRFLASLQVMATANEQVVAHQGALDHAELLATHSASGAHDACDHSPHGKDAAHMQFRYRARITSPYLYQRIYLRQELCMKKQSQEQPSRWRLGVS